MKINFEPVRRKNKPEGNGIGRNNFGMKRRKMPSTLKRQEKNQNNVRMIKLMLLILPDHKFAIIFPLQPPRPNTCKHITLYILLTYEMTDKNVCPAK